MSITKIKNGLICWCLWNDTQSVHDNYAKYASPPQPCRVDDLSYLPVIFSNVCSLILRLPTNTPIYLHSTDEQSILESIKNHASLYNEKKDTRYHLFDIEHFENSLGSWIDQNRINRVLIAGLAHNQCLQQCYYVLDKLQTYLSFEYYTVAGCTANICTEKKITIFKTVDKIDQKKFIDLEMI